MGPRTWVHHTISRGLGLRMWDSESQPNSGKDKGDTDNGKWEHCLYFSERSTAEQFKEEIFPFIFRFVKKKVSEEELQAMPKWIRKGVDSLK